MGASSFSASVYAPDAQTGYTDLVEEALWVHGHDPYNGTISTTYGFIMVPLHADDSLNQWDDSVLEDERIQKRGNCACVKLDWVETNDKGWPLWHFAGWAAE